MHGSEIGLDPILNQEHVHGWSGNAPNDSYLKRRKGGHMNNEVHNGNLEVDCVKDSEEEGQVGVEVEMSEEQILRHPLVMKMMQRLEALEGQQSEAQEERLDSSLEKHKTAKVLEEIPDTEGQKVDFDGQVRVYMAC